ncbi:MAG: alpha-L-arabinofuranosidase C-terminal domain-containing protein [Chitinophagaceae bacterium]
MPYKLKSTNIFLAAIFLLTSNSFVQAQKQSPKKISTDLFGIFFEDISYSADGGLYAELVQNRSFEYTPADRKGWQSLTAWDYITDGFGYGGLSVETASPLNNNNPHYAVLTIEDEGQQGIGLANQGFDGMVIKAGDQYDFTVYIKQVTVKAMPMLVSLRNTKNEIIGEGTFTTDSKDWKKYSLSLTASANTDSARLFVLAKGKGKLCIDMVSLFPQKTFHNRKNGLRADLAQPIADLKPAFMRFPGGCLVHGDGLGNMYRWKNTIGPIEERVEQKNIWNYHQTAGLGYFEFFQFCEDIGAKPLPVLAAAVSCQNSGGTWRIGGTGQRGIPDEEMQTYIQEVLDLIEYANGPATSVWGAKRAAAGHPAPFNLQYVGVGNEDKQTDAFRSRFTMIYNAVKAKHPEITVVGTVGPAPDGEDYEQGWQLANKLAVPVVDEHYYEKPEWFLSNNMRYDKYDRSKSKVYLGEYASRGNTLFNALCEAAYMTALERNADVVSMASYAPLLASEHHTSWNPDLIYFNNTKVAPTINYYVQQLFSVNNGDMYYPNVVSFVNKKTDTLLAASCVKDSRTDDIIVKLVNAGAEPQKANIVLPFSIGSGAKASCTVLSGDAKAKNLINMAPTVLPQVSELPVKKSFSYDLPAYALVVIRIRGKN